MSNKEQIDDLVRQLFKLLPENIEQSKQDIEKNLRAVLNASLARMNLVTREEFDIQSELLNRTRKALDDMERKVSTMEEQQRTE
ncbi:MAG: accessory factor UbiK family protein [Gammaproteobacteria bacterium]